MTVIALDVMGGDRAPQEPIRGAIFAASEGIEVVLVGDQEQIEPVVAAEGGLPSGARVVHAPDAIGMGDGAAREVRRRRESSIYRGLELVKHGEADAFFSAGNTGAVLATALVVLGRIKGVERPALAAVLPLRRGPTLLLDAGANAEWRPSHLVQFAFLGSTYMRIVFGIEEPAVGLLNIGEEATKGSPETIEVHRQLAQSQLRFIGNVEGGDLVLGDADVVVTDGFTGNVSLKLAEGMATMLFGEFRETAMNSLRGRLGGALLGPALRGVRGRLDYRQYGGVPLLGVNGTAFVGHGASDARAIANALRSAAEVADSGLTGALAEAVRAVPVPRTSDA